ncbi:MAG: hypothetical protein GC190_04405 [Alphaproteobacteria bacterium]|nr:hypothetical protein [Alphaproteobacteria bacterium]
MPTIERLFTTKVYRAALTGTAARRLNGDLATACRLIAREDTAGRAWSTAHGYRGYTSYASLNDLPERAPAFAALVAQLDAHVAKFADALDFDLGRRRLKLDSIWLNVMRSGAIHTAHIHPKSVVSGTYYVAVPKGAGALKLEDPRLGLMMAAPLRKARAARDNQTFVYLEPKAGTLLLWESWLRHEVPANRAAGERISISFNYA